MNGLRAKTEIVRHLPGGGEYRHVSKDRRMAYKVGRLAARTISERNQARIERNAA